MNHPSKIPSRELLLLAVASASFSLSGPLSKLVHDLSPVGIGCCRCLLAALVLFALAPKQIAVSLRALSRRQLVALVFAGCFLAAHLAAFLVGLVNTSLSAAVSLVSLEPLSVILVAWLAFGTKPTRRELVGVGMATLGALLVASGAGEGENRLYGDLLVLLAVVIYGAYVASARGLRDAMPMVPYSAGVYATVALVLLPWALAGQTGADGSLRAVSARDWAFVAAVALVPTLIGHTLVQRAARHLPPAIVALVSPGETVGGIVLGIFLFRTWPTALEGLGALVVIAGATVAVTR